jgi:hypothetical protein
MKIVVQHKNGCFPACLNSFLADHGVTKSQREMIDLLNSKGLCDPDGIVDFDNFKVACEVFRIEYSLLAADYQISYSDCDGSLLISIDDKATNQRHVVRYWGPYPGGHDKILVMDPDLADNKPLKQESEMRPGILDLKDIEMKNWRFHRIQMKSSVGN